MSKLNVFNARLIYDYFTTISIVLDHAIYNLFCVCLDVSSAFIDTADVCQSNVSGSSFRFTAITARKIMKNMT